MQLLQAQSYKTTEHIDKERIDVEFKEGDAFATGNYKSKRPKLAL